MAAGAGGRSYIKQQESQRGIGEFAYVQFDKYFNQDKSNKVPEVKEYQPGSSSKANYSASSNIDQTTTADGLNWQDLDEAAKLPATKSVLPNYQLQGEYIKLASSDKLYEAPLIYGKSAPIMPMLLAGKDINQATNQAIITEDFVKAFKLSVEDLVSREVVVSVASPAGELKDFTFKISGVMSNRDSYDALTVISDMAKSMMQWKMGDGFDRASFLTAVAMPNNGVSSKDLEAQIKELGLNAYSSEVGRESMMQSINYAQWGLVGFGLIALIAAIFGVINTQYVSVLERTSQIGIMKSVGARSRDISLLFLFEAGFVGLLGGVIGVLVAYLVSLGEPLIKQVLKFDENMKIFIFEPITVIVIIAALILIAILAGFFPSRKAAKLDPVEALRAE